ncbi:hypothetical protein BST28156_06136 [Burkholderia stagnalis]|nr:hypothetical protein BST28156_06136 [Burkholderia stagnalis]
MRRARREGAGQRARCHTGVGQSRDRTRDRRDGSRRYRIPSRGRGEAGRLWRDAGRGTGCRRCTAARFAPYRTRHRRHDLRILRRPCRKGARGRAGRHAGVGQSRDRTRDRRRGSRRHDRPAGRRGQAGRLPRDTARRAGRRRRTARPVRRNRARHRRDDLRVLRRPRRKGARERTGRRPRIGQPRDGTGLGAWRRGPRSRRADRGGHGRRLSGVARRRACGWRDRWGRWGRWGRRHYTRHYTRQCNAERRRSQAPRSDP